MPKPPPTAQTPGEPSDERRRRSPRALLLGLILTILGLMLWQLWSEFEHAEQALRKRSFDYAEQLNGQLSLDLALKVHAGLEVLRQHALRPAPELQSLPTLEKLRGEMPDLLSLAWISRQGVLLADSAADSRDYAYLKTLTERDADQLYYFSRPAQADSPIYLLLRRPPGVRPDGFWVARFSDSVLPRFLKRPLAEKFLWQLESRASETVLIGNLSRPASKLESLRVLPLDNSDWQLRIFFDPQQARAELIPEQAGKALVFTLCSSLALLALFMLLREQRRLRELNASSARELQKASSALRAIEERVILTSPSGQIRYLNRQAERLLGKSSRQLRGRHLHDLLPALQPQAATRDGEALRIELEDAGERRQFSVSHSELYRDQEESGRVWVLRDVTEEQRALQVIEETRRRYQEIFESTGSALCVLDLASLRLYLQQQGLSDSAAFDQWLNNNPAQHADLLRSMRLTEANQTALRLLGVNDAQQAWELLIGQRELRPGGIRHRIIKALLEGPQLLEMESRITTAQGHERYIWLMLRVPELLQDLQAVTLSLNDVTSRKRIELSLLERERFWSEVANAVPDTLYVHDIPGKRVMFTNKHLGPHLGYSKDELRAMGPRLWEKILHPDDEELYRCVRNMQQVVGDGELMQFQLRWRHRDGSWHWFEIRERALARDADGRVSRLIGVAKDITEQIIAGEALRASEQRYRLLAENTTDVIFSTDRELNLNYVSSSVQSMLGYSPEWVLRHGFFEMAANPRQMEGINSLLLQVRQALGQQQLLKALREQMSSQLFTFDYLRADGRQIPAELHMSLMWDDNGNFEGLLGVGRDVSLQRRADKDLRMAATVFEHSTAAILITDPAGYIVQVNETFSRITGYQPADILDQMPGTLTVDLQQPGRLGFVLRQLDDRGSWEGELWLRRKNGEHYPAWVGVTAVQDDEGDLVSYVCFFSDISERKASEQRIHRLAYYDALTQLPNRTLFQERLYNALQHAERHTEWVVLMFLDLDRFKPINDSLGHAAGDRMLKEVATRLLACVDADDTVARMGGDEFTLLLTPSASHEQALHRAIHVGEQILASLARAFVLEGREFFVTASIGIALSPQDGDESSQLMKNADTAMYHAKERGKNNFQFYQADMNARALERLELESDLRHALDQGEFILYYQPQLSGDGKRLTGVEALLRWQQPRRGLVAPNEFIPVLEELGLIDQVGDWVLQESCRQFIAWQNSGVRVPKISVNLSARQFKDGQLGQRIGRILAAQQMPPAGLELELTESILMGNAGETLAILADLKRLGLCIAVDDFGTGYSSLNYLKQFPIDVLKIDRSFVDGLPDGEQDSQIARAIIAMAHSLSLKVIAEGVETQAQLDFLREHECDEVQGYLFGRPMPASQFESLFSGNALFVLS